MMTREEANKLEPGVYRVYWIDTRGSAVSVGAVGKKDNTDDRDSWLAVSNWSGWRVPNMTNAWEAVGRVELIATQQSERHRDDRLILYALHDIRQDGAGAVEHGAALERGAILELLKRHLKFFDERGTPFEQAQWVVQGRIDEIEKRGPVLHPLPPDRLKEENDRLRKALEGIAKAVERWDGIYESSDFGRVAEKARQALQASPVLI